MSDNGAFGGDDLDVAIAAVAETLGKVKENAEEMAEALALAKSEERRLMTALRALAPEHPLVGAVGKPGPKPTTGTSQKTFEAQDAKWNLEPDRFSLVWEWVKERGDKAFTRTDVTAHFEGKVSHHTINRIVHRLRNQEAIRLAGLAKTATGVGKGPEQFRLLDARAGDKAVADNEEAFMEKNPNGRRY